MAKYVCGRPDWLKATNVVDIFSVSACISGYFFNDYISLWKHNGYWLFDSPEIIRAIALENSIDLQGMALFYYEAHELEFTGEQWRPFSSEPSMPVSVVPPSRKSLDGFDVVTFRAGNSPECSPLSCNSLAESIQTNSHCLIDSFSEAESNLNTGELLKGEHGPYRIFAVYSVDWP